MDLRCLSTWVVVDQSRLYCLKVGYSEVLEILRSVLFRGVESEKGKGKEAFG